MCAVRRACPYSVSVLCDRVACVSVFGRVCECSVCECVCERASVTSELSNIKAVESSDVIRRNLVQL